MSNRRFSLVGITDLREVDWFTGKKMPLEQGEGNECMRCGRMHAVVWEVRDNETGKHWKVGSGCGPRALGGWTPDKEEIKTARKEARERAEQRRLAKIEAEARRIADEVRVLPVPPIERLPLNLEKDPDAFKFQVGDAVAWVNSWDTTRHEERANTARWGWIYNRVIERAKGFDIKIRMDIKQRADEILRAEHPMRLTKPAGGKRRHAKATRPHRARTGTTPKRKPSSRLAQLVANINRLTR